MTVHGSERLERNMKHYLLIISLFLIGVNAYGQNVCTTQAGYVCISQETADKAFALVDKYKIANDTIAALKEQVATLEVSVKDRDDLIAKIKAFGVIDDQIHAKEVQLRSVLESMVTIQNDIIDRLHKQLTGGKTKTQKFLDFLKTAYYVLAGGAIIAGL
jgi:hypothetical protein